MMGGIVIAVAIIIAALIMSDRGTSRRGGYQPVPRELGLPPSRGSSAVAPSSIHSPPPMPPTPYRKAESMLLGQRWTEKEAKMLHMLIDQGAALRTAAGEAE